MQTQLFSNQQRIDAPGASLDYWPYWLSASQQSQLWPQLENLNWQQSVIRIAGKQHLIPRLNAWYGDVGRSYGYSGTRLEFNPWTPELLALKSQIEQVSGQRFNAVLANLYRDGSDSVDWHADNEPELGPKPVIATVSLGGKRLFCMKNKRDASIEKINLELEPGSLFLMQGDTQLNWVHRVPKTKKTVNARISLTFRRVYDDQPTKIR